MPTTITTSERKRQELMSEEISEIISYRPHWLIRRGNFIFLLVVASLLLATIFIQYPDIVRGAGRLVAVNAPKPAIAHKDGKLVAIVASFNQQVVKGQHLAYIESTANYQDVLLLYNWLGVALAKMSKDSFFALSAIPLSAAINLGELQSAYQAFGQEWMEQKQIFGEGYYRQKEAALQKDLIYTARLKETLRQQENLQRQERAIQLTEFAAYDSLARDKVIAPVEVNKFKNNLLAKEQSLIQTSGQLINNDVAAHNKKKELLELQKTVQEQKQKFLSALLTLKSMTEVWIHDHAVTAPEDGMLSLASPLQVNEQVSANQELFYVQPTTTQYYVQVMTGQAGLGKISEEQTVRLKADSYPSEEYGYLNGIVRSVAAFPNRRDSFLVQVELLNGLKTTYGKTLFFRNGLSVRAEIMTDNRTLFDRFFEPLKKLWNR